MVLRIILFIQKIIKLKNINKTNEIKNYLTVLKKLHNITLDKFIIYKMVV